MTVTSRISLAVITAVVVSGLIAAPASAHTQLVGVDPGEGDTVAAADVVTLTFSEELLDLGTEASVTDASGATTPAAVDLSVPTKVAITIPEVAPGAFTLAWRVVSADGHPVEGTVAFTAPDAPVIDTPVSPTASSTPDADGATPDADAASPTPEPTMYALDSPPSADATSTSDGGVSAGGWAAIVAAVVVLAGAGIVLARRRAGR